MTSPSSASSGAVRTRTAQVAVGDHDRGCSGVLVDAERLLTAAGHPAGGPAASLATPAGKPRSRATATIGRTGPRAPRVPFGAVEPVPRAAMPAGTSLAGLRTFPVRPRPDRSIP
ncbi:hypothetical protein SUDANB58_04736 [Streptomyces sp. enrichment culture]|uniref:hypothetical protein n=1 Tax=Streptomyces sp. enrichment culture TaxID=1795815 RepID=UPI003F569612